MEIKVGDKVFLSEEQARFLNGHYDHDKNFTKKIMKIKEITHKNYYMIEVDPQKKLILTLKGTKGFRLATESEIKRDEIKNIFIK
jgi:hypothetical protein